MADDSVVVVDDDGDDSKIVTKFFLSTCRLLQPSIQRVEAVAMCFACATPVARKPPHDNIQTRIDDEIHLNPLIAGSSAEFYIQPMLTCIGDVDIMYHQGDMLAIPYGYPPPTDLPAEFHSRVTVFEIVDSEYPGYVYLPMSYLLAEDSDAGKYNAIRYDKHQYVSTVPPDGREDGYYGPAVTVTVPGEHNMWPVEAVHCSYMFGNPHHPPVAERRGPASINVNTKHAWSCDSVTCIRCLSWPTQAAHWPTRHRNYDWPDSATVDRVVSNGCDVVQVAHPQCRQDEWMSKHQWRLSIFTSRNCPVKQLDASTTDCLSYVTILSKDRATDRHGRQYWNKNI